MTSSTWPWLAPATVLIFLAGACWVRAETPEEQYVRIYGVMQSAETLDGSGQMAAALARYREAEAALQGFQKMYPDWNPRVVKYRLEFLAAKIAVASAKTPAAASKPEPTAAPITPAANPEAAAGLQNQLATLEATVRQLQGDKTLLEARLKEALPLFQIAHTDGGIAQHLRYLRLHLGVLDHGLEEARETEAELAPGEEHQQDGGGHQ